MIRSNKYTNNVRDYNRDELMSVLLLRILSDLLTAEHIIDEGEVRLRQVIEEFDRRRDFDYDQEERTEVERSRLDTRQGSANATNVSRRQRSERNNAHNNTLSTLSEGGNKRTDEMPNDLQVDLQF